MVGAKATPASPAADVYVPPIEDGARVFYCHRERSWEVGVVVGSSDVPRWYNVKAEQQGDESEQVPGHDVFLIEADADKANHRDLLDLPHLHVPALLAVVANRFRVDDIYTFIGNLVIAVNPFSRDIPWYKPEVGKEYVRLGWEEAQPLSQNETVRPHSWAVANRSYWDMMHGHGNQSILISGESGAGKTEGTKIILQYLGDLCVEKLNQSGRAEEQAAIFSVNERLQKASPILEAFGNAKTTRNDNSSRFGKFMEIQFDRDGILVGMHCDPYLLEKSRVVTAGPEERLYHAFYQLIQGATPEMKERYLLQPAKHYPVLNSGGCMKINNVDDAEDFQKVIAAMRTVGFSEDEIDGCWRIVVACLHLSTVEFEGEGEKAAATAKDAEAIGRAATVLQVDAKTLQRVLLFKTRVLRGEETRSPYTLQGARDMRNSVCIFIYEQCFLWMIDQINVIVSRKEDCAHWIGLLDIFGFENFNMPGQKNSFEQLCINLANEQLQHHYNDHVYRKDNEEYTAEGIRANVSVKAGDNQLCLNLLMNDKDSIISVLDDVCNTSKGDKTDDKTFLDRCTSNHGDTSKDKQGKRNAEGQIVVERTKKSDFFEYSARFPDKFAVHHYAGKVVYDVKDFVVKNRAHIPDEVKDMLKGSNLEFVQVLMAKMAQRDADAGAGAGGRPGSPAGSPRGGMKAKTVGGMFKKSLQLLMEKINSTQPNWIRCIRPNPQKRPKLFDVPSVLEQLVCSGVIETVKIRQQGFCYRMRFDEFVQRYAICHGSRKRGTAKDQCAGVLHALELPRTEAQVGTSKVFMRVGAFRKIEQTRAEKLKEHKKTIARWLCWRDSFRLVKRVQIEVMAQRVQRFVRVIQKRDMLIKEWYERRMAALKEEQKRERESFVKSEAAARPGLWKEEGAAWAQLMAACVEEADPLWAGMREKCAALEGEQRVPIHAAEVAQRARITAQAVPAAADARRRERERLAEEERRRRAQREEACAKEEAARAAVARAEQGRRDDLWKVYEPEQGRMRALHGRIVALLAQRDRKLHHLQQLQQAEAKRARRAKRLALRDESALWERHLALCTSSRLGEPQWSVDGDDYAAQSATGFGPSPASAAGLQCAGAWGYPASGAAAPSPCPGGAARVPPPVPPPPGEPLSSSSGEEDWARLPPPRPGPARRAPPAPAASWSQPPAATPGGSAPRDARLALWGEDSSSDSGDAAAAWRQGPPSSQGAWPAGGPPAPQYGRGGLQHSAAEWQTPTLQPPAAPPGGMPAPWPSPAHWPPPVPQAWDATPPASSRRQRGDGWAQPGASVAGSGDPARYEVPFFEPGEFEVLAQLGEAERQRERFFLSGAPSEIIVGAAGGALEGVSSYSDYARRWRENYDRHSRTRAEEEALQREVRRRIKEEKRTLRRQGRVQVHTV
eukprot:TRINITY_DN7246_c1_g1_i1.p1 TRINITY_DN7246_c1_g1~~TRINITY_DN7246_c1_g1_i1.p1  ORF type:complete len:1426 (+),score=404.13 TRINITY_DN7246_c1_g1_i1:62-4279(+)